jgi:hypothetical protein
MTADPHRRQEESKTDPDAGRMLRPEAVVLGDDALVPEHHFVRPAPNRFSHEIAVDEPYRFDRPQPAADPDGLLPAGTRVVLLVEGPDRCWVVDPSGLYVEVRRASLRELPDT